MYCVNRANNNKTHNKYTKKKKLREKNKINDISHSNTTHTTIKRPFGCTNTGFSGLRKTLRLCCDCGDQWHDNLYPPPSFVRSDCFSFISMHSNSKQIVKNFISWHRPHHVYSGVVKCPSVHTHVCKILNKQKSTDEICWKKI